MKKLLIVDDEVNILTLLSRALKGDDTEILTATRMADAEFAIKNAHPELIIADLRLTGVLGQEGLELLSYVREKSPNSKVIIMTGYGSAEIEREAYERGALFYFEKPVDLQLLRDTVKQAGFSLSAGRKRPAGRQG